MFANVLFPSFLHPGSSPRPGHETRNIEETNETLQLELNYNSDQLSITERGRETRQTYWETGNWGQKTSQGGTQPGQPADTRTPILSVTSINLSPGESTQVTNLGRNA